MEYSGGCRFCTNEFFLILIIVSAMERGQWIF
ncbi:hypothetical protein M2105_002027 [Paenibacillus sp. PastF-1]|nr:hypothetical protein [Paenibacillus sp. PastF-2]MDF9847601.1 hypothetical protein [Paenibacillus sp. PastM-2]MDF9854170.1 hypothetical protein [Paenibacillus sp. PastF-1]